MSTIARFAVLLASALAALPSTAGAVTWHSTGPAGPSGISDSFHATASNLLTWRITQSTGTGLGGTQCGGVPTATGTAPVGTFSPSYSITGTFRATPCNVLGQALDFECAYQFTAAVQSATTPAVTSGVTDLTCKLTADVAPFTGTYCTFEGTAVGHYTNPTYPTTPGRLPRSAVRTITSELHTTLQQLFDEASGRVRR